MQRESVVYGYIKSSCSSKRGETDENLCNRRALMALPSMDSWPFLSREMFTISPLAAYDNASAPSMIHFGHCYDGVEYEWNLWMSKFESLLQKMYWESVVVHLQTELSGLHTFTWESGANDHVPSEVPLNIRCEWQHELGLASRRV